MKKAGTAALGIAVAGLLILWGARFYFGSPQPSPPSSSTTAPSQTESPAPTPVPSVASPKPSVSISARDRRMLSDLNEILASKNDNDARLDTEFRHLTDTQKALFIQRYRELPMEARNERGTIVFLIGRDINRPEDCQFLAQVTSEPPCTNLADCSKPPTHTEEDLHEGSTISVTLAYPQHVAVKSMENFLAKPDQNPSLVQSCLTSLDHMTQSPVTPIAQNATTLSEQYADLRK